MSLKWTGTESGILRKSEFKEKKEELFVFGYSCKLFRDDERALLVDQGRHLIPWMGDETLKIDRYDARGALHDLSALEAPPGGFDWRVELTKGELDVEQRCDEERYRALHTDEDEEEMYKEEELKRLHAAGYGQVGFNYDAPSKPEPTAPPAEVDEPFVPTPSFKAMLPHDVVLPESDKQNVIIEKTATFIAMQGAQMEILIKAKQGDNPQFKFLDRESELHPYYMALIALVKAGKWPDKKPEVVEEKPLENEDYLHPSLASTIIESAPSIPSIHYKPSADCDYTMLISKMRGEATLDEAYTPELAPGEVAPPGTEPLPPRATAEISRAPVMYNRDGSHAEHPAQPLAAQTAHYQQYAAYYHQYMAQTAALQATQAQPAKQDPPVPQPVKSTGLSLMKHYNTDSDSDVSDFDDSSSGDSKDKPAIVEPPADVQVVVDKMAAYVARNGDEFAEIVRAKRDPRFAFLDPGDVHHAYYTRLMHQKRGVNGRDKHKKSAAAPVSFSIKKLKEPDPILPKPALPYESSSDEESENKQTDKQPEKPEEKEQPRTILPQAYSTTNILQVYPTANIPPVVVYKMEGPKENTIPTTKATDTVNIMLKPKILSNVLLEKEEPKERDPEKIPPKDVVQPEKLVPRVEEAFKSASPEKKLEKSRDVDKMRDRDIEKTRDRDIEKTRDRDIEKIRERDIDTIREKDIEKFIQREIDRTRDRDMDKTRDRYVDKARDRQIDNRDREADSRYKDREKDSPRRDKRKHRDRKREHSSKSDNRELRRSMDREQKKDKDGDRLKKKIKYSKDDLESEIISLEDNSDDMIDLTGDLSDSKGECEGETERGKQLERRRRAAEFLKKVGVDPAAAALPTNSLASAMVDTLESIRKKKAEEEEKRRKREKRRHRDRHGYNNSADKSHRKSKRRKYRSSDDNEESDYDGSKKKKRKKDKKASRSKKKRRREADVEGQMDHPLPPDMDLSTTLKELRTSSPTKELGLQDEECTQPSFRRECSSDEEEVKKPRVVRKKRDYREYSEGEWSSDSEGDSGDSSRNGD